MLKSYQRRAFLALAVVALEPLAVPVAQAEEPRATEPLTLWETLNHVERVGDKKKAAADPDEPTLIPLGAVPGFSLPSVDRVGSNSASVSSKKKKQYRGMLGPVSRLWDTVLNSTGSKIDVKGDATLSLRQDNVSGGSQASQTYQDQYYYGQGSNGVYTNTSLHVDATLFKYLHYNSTISNSPYRTPGENRVKLDYNTKKTRFQMGDINAGFQGNSLIDFSRYLSGVQFENQWSRQLKTTMLFSRTKAETKTLTVTGNDSAGPYYLFSGQIVDGSAHVRVDNRDLSPGKDYTLDANTGQLQFLNGNVVLHSQTIAITYETLGYNQSQGTIYGFRTQFTPRGSTNFGLTYVTQQTRALTALTQRTQQFYGVEQPAATYRMDSAIDTTKPINVTVNGVPLVAGTPAAGDYWFDSAFPTDIHLRNPVPSTQQVIVKYVPLDSSPTPGNRSVMGLDGHVGLGRWGGLTLETAFSGLDLTGKNYSGKAAQIRADLNPLRNLTTHITLRGVGATYSSIQSPGFNRNEKSLDISGDYSPTSRLHLNYAWQNAKRPSYSYSNNFSNGVGAASQYNIISQGEDTYKQYSMGVAYDITRNAKISLSRNSLGTNYITGGFSKSTSDTLDLNWSIRQFSVNAALSRNVADTNSPNGYYGIGILSGTNATGTTTTGAYNSQSSTLTRRIGLNYDPLRWLHLNSSISDNDIHNTGTGYTGALQHTNATDRQVSARITPGRGLSFLYSYDLSDTGNANSLTNSTTGTTPGTGTAVTTGTTGTSTGTTTTGTGVSGTGVAGTRSVFFQPWTRAVTRQSATTGNTTTGIGTTNTLPTVVTPVGTLAGGGINANLGAAGNYSSYLGNGSSSLGVTSLGGRSSTNRFGMDYAISQALHLNLGYDASSSIGDYQYNSNRNNTNFGLNYNPSDRWAFNISMNAQKVAYTGSLGGTNSSSILFGFTGRPFGNKITTTINWQSVRTKSALNLTSLGAAVGATTATNPLVAASNNSDSNLSSMAARVDVPLSSRYVLFVDWLHSNATGYLGNTESDLRFGTDIYLNQILKFSLGWQTVNRANKDSSLANYNYHSSSLLAEFGLHF